MSQRIIRLNKLIARNLSVLLHQEYPAEALHITLSNVRVSPDLRQARVFYSLAAGEIKEAQKFLNTHSKALRMALAKRVCIKYLPSLSFHYDKGLERSSTVLNILRELDNGVG
jgi:ribosome-binding factor A